MSRREPYVFEGTPDAAPVYWRSPAELGVVSAPESLASASAGS